MFKKNETDQAEGAGATILETHPPQGTLLQLTPEEIQNWTLEQKDAWWLKNVYRGDMPQLTFRAAVTGAVLGGVLSLTNLYVGIRTGWTLGVGITSVTLSFALFKVLAKFRLGNEMTVLENNAMQSIATSAGYMTAPLVSSLPAFMLVTGKVIPAWQAAAWMIGLSLLGVLFAFPLKKRFINDEQLPFPEGYAAGVVMHNLHTGSGEDGLFRAKVLGAGGLVTAMVEFLRSEKATDLLRIPFLRLPGHWDDFIYRFATPKILGTPLKDLTVQWDSSLVMVAAGGIMGVRAGFSLLVGAAINYLVIAPILIQQGIIAGGGFKRITLWALWGGVAMMTTSSLYSFFAKPDVLLAAFRRKGPKSGATATDVLASIELPTRVSAIGIPVIGAIMVAMGYTFFGMNPWLGALAIPLVFVFSLIAITSTGLTSITPGGALGKLTQLTYSVLSPGNIANNITSAGIMSEVSLNASNLLMDIKPGYMLGAKPRQQAVGHVIGVFAGAAVAVPVYYLIFHGDLSLLTSEKLPMPGAVTWKGVAEVLTQGLSFLHPSARWAAAIGAGLGIALEWLHSRSLKAGRGGIPLSGVGLGLAMVLPFTDSLAMGGGAVAFWAVSKRLTTPGFWRRVLVDNQETLCAGGIAGGSIVGIILILLETLG